MRQKNLIFISILAFTVLLSAIYQIELALVLLTLILVVYTYLIIDKYITKQNEKSFVKENLSIAKSTILDNEKLMGSSKGFRITVRELILSNGAGFIVALTGNVLTMPGLPKHPAALDLDIDENGKITGRF